MIFFGGVFYSQRTQAFPWFSLLWLLPDFYISTQLSQVTVFDTVKNSANTLEWKAYLAILQFLHFEKTDERSKVIQVNKGWEAHWRKEHTGTWCCSLVLSFPIFCNWKKMGSGTAIRNDCKKFRNALLLFSFWSLKLRAMLVLLKLLTFEHKKYKQLEIM